METTILQKKKRIDPYKLKSGYIVTVKSGVGTHTAKICGNISGSGFFAMNKPCPETQNQMFHISQII